MKIAAAVVYLITFAQGIQAVALAGVEITGQLQRIQHPGMAFDPHRVVDQAKLHVQEADIEWRVVDQ
jgi:hypothetical protein